MGPAELGDGGLELGYTAFIMDQNLLERHRNVMNNMITSRLPQTF